MECIDSPIQQDEVKLLSQSIPEASKGELLTMWERIQTYKWVDESVPFDILFEKLEYPLIKKLYPPEYVNPKVKALISVLNKRSQTYSKRKLNKYHEARRYGLSIEKARASIQPTFTEEFLQAHATLYSRPFTYKYDISIHDADLIYSMGMDKFIKTFYDRFYQPIDKPNNE